MDPDKFNTDSAKPNPEELARELEQRAIANSQGISVTPKGQLSTAAGTATAVGGIAWYLGVDTNYFSSGLTGTETPLYVTFLAIAALSVTQLASICGRRDGKALLAGVLTGGATGTSVGLGIAGIAFGLIADIATYWRSPSLRYSCWLVTRQEGRKISPSVRRKASM